jgi:hypothetical protein
MFIPMPEHRSRRGQRARESQPEHDETVAAILDGLIRNKGKRVTFTFDDGDVVDAVLLDIDPVEHHDLTFELIAVRRSTEPKRYAPPKKVFVASIDSVTRVEPII